MKKYFILPLLLLTAIACRDDEYIAQVNYEYEDTNDDDPYDEEQVDTELYPDWTEATHSNNVDPNFDLVFAQDNVMRLDLTITTANLSAMQADLKSNLSSSSSNWPGMGGGGVTSVDFTPIWVPCTVSHDGKDWYEVGVRYKGNSSLSSAYSSGIGKLSMKLDFDEYEDVYPELKNQRFYGFKQLNLGNNYNDNSCMREKIASDLFRSFGMVAAHTRFCAIYVNNSYYGLYTMVEEVDDTVIETQFADDSGNLYKPEDDAAQFYKGSYDTSEFNLKTNTDAPDYSDVLALYNALHDESRTSNTESWKTLIESTFDVDTFMKWLAVTTTIQNWDIYGNMAHNYFIYNNPSTGVLTWIPWDHNEAFQSASGQGTAFDPEDLSDSRYVSTSWPLINYLIRVDEYAENFDAYLEEFITDVFVVETLQAQYDTYSALIKEYVYAEEKGYTFLSYDSQFDSAVSTLKSHASTRNAYVANYLK